MHARIIRTSLMKLTKRTKRAPSTKSRVHVLWRDEHALVKAKQIGKKMK